MLIHVHLGYLPELRGADCLLWSNLLSGYPSGSCFVLDKGIDTGAIIKSKFLPKIYLPDAAKNLGEKQIYRLLYSFVDPWVRAVVLRETIFLTNFLKKLIQFYNQKTQDKLFISLKAKFKKYSSILFLI